MQAKAAVTQAQAALARAERNLAYCTITSPVQGVIIDRRVKIGQTVVSSLNAPSLFLIAKDLTRMQVCVLVNEADIGNILPGQAATITGDAHPEWSSGTPRAGRDRFFAMTEEPGPGLERLTDRYARWSGWACRRRRCTRRSRDTSSRRSGR
jgi:hypothetical protein